MSGPPSPFPGTRPRSRLVAFALGLALCAWGIATLSPANAAIRAEHGMVVSPDSAATSVGVDVLRRGGNAVDAAVAVALALAVTHPLAGNLGGGGFMLYRDPAARHHALDFRETAPRKLRPAHFLDDDGRPIPGLSRRGGLAVGVPGSLAGLYEAHRRWGTLPWVDLVAPAIRLADEGFVVPPYLAETFERSGDGLLEDPEARRIFAPAGRLPIEGQTLVQHDLAATLRSIAKDPRSFYEGRPARAIARTVRRRGGVMDRKDLARYEPASRQALERRYRGYRVISFPPPSSGGIVLLQMLGMLERFDLAASGFGSALSVHLLVEVERRAYADRSRWLGDPDFYDVPGAGLLDSDYLARRAATIDPERATPSSRVGPGRPAGSESQDTLHFSVADGDGAAVSLTTTLNTAFGSGMVAEGTGVLLNNEIDDFALAPGMPNVYGLLGGAANTVAGGKRPLSSMTPTIVERVEPTARPVLILGSPGGSTIITSVLQVLVNLIDHGMDLQHAVDAPRFHHQWQPDVVSYEEGAFSEALRRELERRGHRLELAPQPLGNVNAIALHADGAWLGVPDPRRGGRAAGP